MTSLDFKARPEKVSRKEIQSEMSYGAGDTSDSSPCSQAIRRCDTEVGIALSTTNLLEMPRHSTRRAERNFDLTSSLRDF